MKVTKNEIIAEFEAAYEEDSKASELKSQASELTKARAERLKSFASDAEVEVKLINKAYGRYKELKKGTIDVNDEDFYTLMATVDEAFADEEGDGE